MNFGRKALLIFITPLFSLLLFATALDFGILHLAGSPNPLKKLLSDSGIYQNVIPHALDNIKQTSGTAGQVSLNDPAVKNAAEKALSPQVIQQSTNQIIDGIYHWLNGQTALPDFQVNLSGAKSTFATFVGQSAEQKASSLPACPPGLSGVPTSFDAFSATCLPVGLTAAQVGSSARDTILQSQDFLKDPVITASTLKSSDSNTSVFADKQNVPKQFQRAKKTPLLLALLTVLAGGLIVLLSSTRLKGLRHIGFTLLFVGLLMLVFSWTLNWAVDSKVLPKLDVNNAALSSDIKNLIRDVVQAIDKNYWIFGAIYAVLGAAAVATPMLLPNKYQAKPAAKPAKSEPGAPEPAEAAEPKPKHPPKVQ